MRRRVPDKAKPKRPGKPLKPVMGQDGQLYQAIVVAQSRPFARACLDAWSKSDGRDRGHMIRQSSIMVPVTVIALAREALDAARGEP